MALEFNGNDGEFAISTGSNIGAGSDSSTFDTPLDAVSNLVVTVQDGDSDPRLFEIGDTYDLQWGGSNGYTILNAVVIRSDSVPGDHAGVIVFQGVNEYGDPVELIWTPGYDLEGWYNDNYDYYDVLGFYTYDLEPQYTHSYMCFTANTRIQTSDGFKPAGQLKAGDKIRTKDAGIVAVRWVGQETIVGLGPAAPVVFAPGSIGNSRELRLSQQHRVLIRSPQVNLLFGLNEVLVPAKACVNGDTIRMRPCLSICYVHLLLADHHLLFAEGAECESLFMGDVAQQFVPSGPDALTRDQAPPLAISHKSLVRPVLTIAESQVLMATIQAENTHEKHLSVG